jgi:hypothetical protein
MLTEVKPRRPPRRPPLTDVRLARVPARASSRRIHWLWLDAGLALAFAIPFVFADLFGVPRDGYYAIYAVSVATFLTLWARRTEQDARAILRRNVRWAIGLGLVFAALMAFIVLQDASTAHPQAGRSSVRSSGAASSTGRSTDCCFRASRSWRHSRSSQASRFASGQGQQWPRSAR